MAPEDQDEDTVHSDGFSGGFGFTPFDLPDGCIGTYYPEMNPLIPLWCPDKLSKTPAAKGVPVRIVPQGSAV